MTNFYQFWEKFLGFFEKKGVKGQNVIQNLICAKNAQFWAQILALCNFITVLEEVKLFKAGWTDCGKTWPSKCQWDPHRDWWHGFALKRLIIILYLLSFLYLFDEFVVFVCLLRETGLATQLFFQVSAKKVTTSWPIRLFLFSFAFLLISIGFARLLSIQYIIQ